VTKPIVRVLSSFIEFGWRGVLVGYLGRTRFGDTITGYAHPGGMSTLGIFSPFQGIRRWWHTNLCCQPSPEVVPRQPLSLATY
jgi:hypothetical protein